MYFACAYSQHDGGEGVIIRINAINTDYFFRIG